MRYETGVQILAGVFDRFPELQLATGHWGEMVLFYLEHIDELTKPAKLKRAVSVFPGSRDHHAGRHLERPISDLDSGRPWL